MARFLLASTPVPGHVLPMAGLAHRLVERGHEVRWYTGAAFADHVARTGARHCPVTHARDWSLRDMNDAVPGLRAKKGLAQVRLAFERVFIDAAPGALADLERLLADEPADLVVADPLVMAVPWLHERGGPVYANLGTTMLGLYSTDTAPFGPALAPRSSPVGRLRNRAMNAVHRRAVFAPVNRHLDDVRSQQGLVPQGRAVIDTFLSPFLYLQDTVEAFEYPRSDLPPQVHFVGPLLPAPPDDFGPPPWWDDLSEGRPVVLVTQGTVRNCEATLIAPTIEALAGEDVLLVVATGGDIAGLPAKLPGNVRLERYVPFQPLMPHLSAMVTNGGYGGVQLALSHGVPLVVAGATEDKPEVAARVSWSGTGVRLRGASPTPKRLARAVGRVLTEPGYRRNARRMAGEMARHDPAGEAAELLEELVSRRGPVTEHPGAELGIAPAGPGLRS